MTDINFFDYALPEELIAQRPAPRREESRLMTLDRHTGEIGHESFGAFPAHLREGDLLVINTTKVFAARLAAKRSSGASVEILLTRRRGEAAFEAMVRGLAKVRPGETLIAGDGEVTLIEKLPEGKALVDFGSGANAERLIEKFGGVPLPPYIRREGGVGDEADRERYQTVFARQTGSCAAPTAGLHFTDAILDEIKSKGVEVAEVTLHVGPGTFRPVKTEAIEDHVMDAEPFEVPRETSDAINCAKAGGRRVVAVGSTVTRTIESAATADGYVRTGPGETSLYITPGFRFLITDAMLTNFHLPKSTLLILVSAFAGRDKIMKAYEEAVREKYRFFSYGDAIFIS